MCRVVGILANRVMVCSFVMDIEKFNLDGCRCVAQCIPPRSFNISTFIATTFLPGEIFPIIFFAV
jgi:hypothetical protein